MRRALPSLLAVLLLASGCLDINFDPPSIVKGPRILAALANPPEALFGEDIHFEVLAVDQNAEDLTTQEGVEVRWTVCLSVEQIIDAAGLGGGAGFADDCPPDQTLVLEEDGSPSRAFLPGETLLGILTMIPMGGGDPVPDPMIPGLDPSVLSTLTTVIAEVGVPLAVRIEVIRDGDVVIKAYKRFAITTRSGATLNPPPPRLTLGDVEVSARAFLADPHACVSGDGTLPTVAAGAELALMPNPLEDPWLETYPVFDLAGEIIDNHETAYYSWFSTAGAFESEITQRPERDTTWTAPAEPGTYPIFVVVRDGHLGISWCRADVVVTAN
ncbi:MAG: hypothetical protein KC619_35460 [Myxococcales bacterium]|nr:hypothetical protein [Myxococcales bacterium]